MKCEKKQDGYILRASFYDVLVALVGCVFSLICMVVFPLCLNFVLPDFSFWDGLIISLPFIYLLVFSVVLMVDRIGYTMILDGEGVHIKRTLRRERILPWRHIREWGVTRKHRDQKRKILYFSPRTLTCDRNSGAKSFPRSAGALSIQVFPDEYAELVRSGGLDFCRKQLDSVARYVVTEAEH